MEDELSFKAWISISGVPWTTSNPPSPVCRVPSCTELWTACWGSARVQARQTAAREAPAAPIFLAAARAPAAPRRSSERRCAMPQRARQTRTTSPLRASFPSALRRDVLSPSDTARQTPPKSKPPKKRRSSCRPCLQTRSIKVHRLPRATLYERRWA